MAGTAGKVMRIDRDAGTLRPPTRTPQGFLRADGWVARPGIYEYVNTAQDEKDGLGKKGTIRRELRPEEEVYRQDALDGYEGAPITVMHPKTMVDATNVKNVEVGTVTTSARRDGDRVAVTMVIKDAKAIERVDRRELVELSPGYNIRIERKAGKDPRYATKRNPDGRYDCIQRDIEINHLALVDRARGGEDLRVRLDGVNAAPADVDGRVGRLDWGYLSSIGEYGSHTAPTKVTSIENGHQHTVSCATSSGRTSYELAEGDEAGHDHAFVKLPDGSYIITENSGHSHTIIDQLRADHGDHDQSSHAGDGGGGESKESESSGKSGGKSTASEKESAKSGGGKKADISKMSKPEKAKHFAAQVKSLEDRLVAGEIDVHDPELKESDRALDTWASAAERSGQGLTGDEAKAVSRARSRISDRESRPKENVRSFVVGASDAAGLNTRAGSANEKTEEKGGSRAAAEAREKIAAAAKEEAAAKAWQENTKRENNERAQRLGFKDAQHEIEAKRAGNADQIMREHAEKQKQARAEIEEMSRREEADMGRKLRAGARAEEKAARAKATEPKETRVKLEAGAKVVHRSPGGDTEFTIDKVDDKYITGKKASGGVVMIPRAASDEIHSPSSLPPRPKDEKYTSTGSVRAGHGFVPHGSKPRVRGRRDEDDKQFTGGVHALAGEASTMSVGGQRFDAAALRPGAQTMDPEEQIRSLKAQLAESEKVMKERTDALTEQTARADRAEAAVKTHEDTINELSTKLEAGAEALETQAIREQAERADAAEAQIREFDQRFDRAVQERTAIIRRAMMVMGPDFNPDSMTNREIQAIVVKRLDSAADVSSKQTDAYLSGRFDSLVELHGKTARSLTRAGAAISGNTSARTDSTTASRADAREERKNAWRNQWREPLPNSRDARDKKGA